MKKEERVKHCGNDNKIFWIWLSLACGVASKEFGRLVSRFDDAYELYTMSEEDIEGIDGIGARLKMRLSDKTMTDAERIFEDCQKGGVTVLTYADKAYPPKLRLIEDPPVVLYVLGKISGLESHPSIGVVGTRKMSEYGRKTAFRLSYELALAGTVIVSGLALGVDGVAACGALEAEGNTIAVLGCGVLVDYPKAHRKLKAQIVRRGAVISEYPPNTPAVPRNFPTRNRIISGICHGTLLVEGAKKSGSMITARLAIGQGRQLFAVPGKIGEVNSEGPNHLIREGAYSVLESIDILKHYEFLYRENLNLRALRATSAPDCDETLRRFGVPTDYEEGRRGGRPFFDEARTAQKTVKNIKKEQKEEPAPTPSVPLSPLEQSVLSRMPMDKPTAPDALCADGCGIGEVLTALTMLELYGIVTSLPGGLYVRK